MLAGRRINWLNVSTVVSEAILIGREGWETIDAARKGTGAGCCPS